LFIGHAGHPEVIGTFGQVPEGGMTLVETLEDVARLSPADPQRLAFLTQTTLSVDDTAAIVDALKHRFPALQGPRTEDICYATSNRQEAVKAIAQRAQLVLVIGAPNSSNSQRLREVAERLGARAYLIGRAQDMDWQWFAGVSTLGLTAGASAPEILVQEVIDHVSARFDVTLEHITTAVEDIAFKLPRELVS
jgi:4-hydroxy-3-methylbut-2-enyl diphosphate reductase